MAAIAPQHPGMHPPAGHGAGLRQRAWCGVEEAVSAACRVHGGDDPDIPRTQETSILMVKPASFA
jgi:hypothetical protein